jgi:hypothetical protein
MRGDSIRDFYAKTLALLGLGVLAGTGALVDYWPSGVALPAVESALQRVELAGSLPIPASEPEVVRVPTPRRQPRASAPEQPPLASAASGRSQLVLALATFSELETARPMRLSPPSPAVPVATFASYVNEFPMGEEVALSSPAGFLSTGTLALAAPPPSPDAAPAEAEAEAEVEDDGDGRGGLLTGAVKRTGTSIVRTGRKTGAYILEAFRLAGGAVRKALPN